MVSFPLDTLCSASARRREASVKKNITFGSEVLSEGRSVQLLETDSISSAGQYRLYQQIPLCSLNIFIYSGVVFNVLTRIQRQFVQN